MDQNPIKIYLAKYFTNLVSILTFCGVVLLGWKVWQDSERSKEERLLLEERYARLFNTGDSFEKLSAGYAQLATLYKEQSELAKDVALQWKDLALEAGERVKLKNDTTITIPEQVQEQAKSDYEFLTPEGKNGFILNELRINGKDSPPIGYVLVKKDGAVAKKNYKFEIRVESVQLKDDLTGKIRVISRAFLVPLEDGLAGERRPDLKKWKGEKYPLDVTGGEVIIDPLEPIVATNTVKRFIPWTLNLNAGFGFFGQDQNVDTKATFGVTMAGYGYNKQNLDWKFGTLGVNYSSTAGLGLHMTPIAYRPLSDILTNTYIGPGVFVTDKGYGYSVNLDIGL